jgi:ActR/RegA family two-component response regulator
VKEPPKPKVLLIDDEPYYLEWLQDYIESRGYSIEWAHNADDGILKVSDRSFEALIIDLKIPATDTLRLQLTSRGALYQEYPGLSVAHAARDRGYESKKVILYSGHEDTAVDSAAAILSCRYANKQQPAEFKRAVDSILPKRKGKAASS